MIGSENGVEAEVEDIASAPAPKPRRKARVSPADAGISRPVTLAGRSIVLDVLGAPAPKGSARAMLIGGRARLITGSSNGNMTAQSRWSRAVREVALAQPDRYVGGVPLLVVIEFRVARPAAAKRRLAPTVKPDLDKLVRCTLDALVTTKQRGKVLPGIIDDDSRIVRLEVEKCYAEPGNEGARIVIGQWCAGLSTGLPSDLVPDALTVQLSRARRA